MLDGYIYAVGGWEGSARLDSVESYNPSNNTWRFVASMKMAVTSPAVVAHEGKLYVTGVFINISSAGPGIFYQIMMTSSNGIIFRVTGPLCGEFTGPGEFPAQRPVTQSFDVFFDLRLNKCLSKQPRGWLFETPLWSLWRQCNVLVNSMPVHLGALGIARPSTGMILTVLGNRIAYSYLSLSKVQQPVPFLDWQAFPLWR